MNPDLKLLSLFGFACFLVLTFFAYRWLFSRADDEAAGVLLGPETLSLDDASGRAALRAASPAWPAKHFISSCMYCHHVTRSDAAPVRVGDELRVSHGICPRCMAQRHPEIATAAELAHA